MNNIFLQKCVYKALSYRNENDKNKIYNKLKYYNLSAFIILKNNNSNINNLLPSGKKLRIETLENIRSTIKIEINKLIVIKCIRRIWNEENSKKVYNKLNNINLPLKKLLLLDNNIINRHIVNNRKNKITNINLNKLKHCVISYHQLVLNNENKFNQLLTLTTITNPSTTITNPSRTINTTIPQLNDDKIVLKISISKIWDRNDSIKVSNKLYDCHLSSTKILLLDNNTINNILVNNNKTKIKNNNLSKLKEHIKLNRLDYRLFSHSKILFTAPHSIRLLRDNHQIHKKELYTKKLCIEFANIANAHYIAWDDKEIKRVEQLNDNIDNSNRDPNYLRDNELLKSWWTRLMKKIKGNIIGVSYHIDIHGMKDPQTTNEADCMCGVGAMLTENREKAKKFQNDLEKYFIPALEKIKVIMNNTNNSNVRELKLQVGGNLTETPMFQGNWKLVNTNSDRNTLTQISAKLNYSYSVQIELSMRLRKILVDSYDARRYFVHAIINAVL